MANKNAIADTMRTADTMKIAAVVGVVLSLLMMSAAGTYYFVRHSSGDGALGGASHASSAGDDDNSDIGGEWREYKDVSANLAGGSGMLQATVNMQLRDEHALARLDQARPLVLAKINDIFSSIDANQIADPRIKARLALDVRDSVNDILGRSGSVPVRRVVFSTFIWSPQ